MERAFDILKQSRSNFLHLVKDLSDEALNIIPENFNNNIIWHLGHLVVTQELLCYKLSGLPCNVPDEMIARYRKGTRPEAIVQREEIAQIKDLLVSSVDQLEGDFNKGIFENFVEYPTSFRFTLRSIDDAIHFNNVHEGLHMGYIMAQLRSLKG